MKEYVIISANGPTLQTSQPSVIVEMCEILELIDETDGVTMETHDDTGDYSHTVEEFLAFIQD